MFYIIYIYMLCYTTAKEKFANSKGKLLKYVHFEHS